MTWLADERRRVSRSAWDPANLGREHEIRALLGPQKTSEA
jgi:hypothetical protein